MHVEIKQSGTWKHAAYLVGADAESDVRPFLDGVAERLIQDGYAARVAACKKKRNPAQPKEGK